MAPSTMKGSAVGARWLFAISLALGGCSGREPAKPGAEEEAVARTEFTSRIENFFEYQPLKALRLAATRGDMVFIRGLK